jgi:hypothetical protein
MDRRGWDRMVDRDQLRDAGRGLRSRLPASPGRGRGGRRAGNGDHRSAVRAGPILSRRGRRRVDWAPAVRAEEPDGGRGLRWDIRGRGIRRSENRLWRSLRRGLRLDSHGGGLIRALRGGNQHNGATLRALPSLSRVSRGNVHRILARSTSELDGLRSGCRRGLHGSRSHRLRRRPRRNRWNWRGAPRYRLDPLGGNRTGSGTVRRGARRQRYGRNLYLDSAAWAFAPAPGGLVRSSHQLATTGAMKLDRHAPYSSSTRKAAGMLRVPAPFGRLPIVASTFVRVYVAAEPVSACLGSGQGRPQAAPGPRLQRPVPRAIPVALSAAFRSTFRTLVLGIWSLFGI